MENILHKTQENIDKIKLSCMVDSQIFNALNEYVDSTLQNMKHILSISSTIDESEYNLTSSSKSNESLIDNIINIQKKQIAQMELLKQQQDQSKCVLQQIVKNATCTINNTTKIENILPKIKLNLYVDSQHIELMRVIRQLQLDHGTRYTKLYGNIEMMVIQTRINIKDQCRELQELATITSLIGLAR
jgi:hypothetical protein